MSTVDGLVVVDKPAGWTSHDVVARIRRLAGVRRVGHAGTLDPMATGVLVVGVGKATRLLGHLTLTDKAYDATIRLGVTTTTDDAEGEVTVQAPASHLTDEAIRAGVARLTGPITQVPPQVSAIKVAGRRAYASARAGQTVELAPRRVIVHSFDVREIRHLGELVEVDASVTCSSGTYVRALARDLGTALGVGGHLRALRRTRVGPFTLEQAIPLDRLGESFQVTPLAGAVAALFPRRQVSPPEARRLIHGGRIPAAGLGPGPVGVFDQDGKVLALVTERGGEARPLVVFVSS